MVEREDLFDKENAVALVRPNPQLQLRIARSTSSPRW